MYKVVIGLEVHCELETKSKNFSFAPNEFTEAHNINVATVDLGLPGILPIANKEGVRKALKTAMALHCKLPDEIIFDRKNYYYADLPKGYQITQNTKPVGLGGYLDVLVNGKVKRVTLQDIHLEEDTASLETLEEENLLSNRKDPGAKEKDCTGTVEVSKNTGIDGKLDDGIYTVNLCCI